MQQLTGIHIGSDIELFVQDKTTKEIISAEGYIKGTKNNPFVFDESNKYFATSLDNILAEICIPPAKTAEEFCRYINKSVDYVNSVIPKEFCTVAQPAALINERWLQTIQSQVFGCEPDFNAYTQFVNDPPFSPMCNLRSAGLHLHVSYNHPEPFDIEELEFGDCRTNIIKAMDLWLGVPSVLLEPENQRKELYGKAGSFRPKVYGVEYRTLSNYYVNDNGRLAWLYENTTNAINWLNDGNTVGDKLGKFIEETINTNNKKAANSLIREYAIKM